MTDRDGPGGPTKRPLSAAERSRCYRDRKREGVELYQVGVSPAVKRGFVKLGWMSEEEARDRRRVAEHLEDFIDCLVRGSLDMEKIRAAIEDRGDSRKLGNFEAGPIICTGTRT